MLIRLKNSRLFTTHPSKRFAEEYQVEENLWNEMWKRYKLLDYSVVDLADLFNIKSGKVIERRYIKRWLFLSEIYIIAQPAREMGVEVINTERFGELEQKLIEEVTRHMKSGSTQDSRIMA